MIVVEVDGQKVRLINGQWGGNPILAPMLQIIGGEFPFKGGGYFPDAWPRWQRLFPTAMSPLKEARTRMWFIKATQ